MLPSTKLLYLGFLYSLLMLLETSFEFVFLSHLHKVLMLALFTLSINKFLLLGLLLFVQENSIGDFGFLVLSFLSHSQDFLSVLLLSHLLLFGSAKLGMHSLFVFLLQANDLIGPTLCLLNLFPSFHFFLFQKCDSVSQ